MDAAVSSHRRWWTLAAVGLATLMGDVDATIVTIALPHAQHELQFSLVSRQWVISAYALAFGSLLLFAGRLSDRFGRRNLLLVGLVGFAVASGVGAFAPSYGILVLARTIQGLFAALIAPAALATVTTTFAEPGERARAFAVYGSLSAAVAAAGLLLGGALTQWATWRWCLGVNVVVAMVALVGVVTLVPRDRDPRRNHLDYGGALLAGGGLFAVVFGLGDAESAGWGQVRTWGLLLAGVAVLAAFLVWQRRAASPLLPLALVARRTRAGALIALFMTSVGLFGVALFLSYYFQDQQHETPFRTGIFFLPLVAALALSATLASARLWHRVGPRPLIPAGMLLSMMGMILLTRLCVNATYLGSVLPGLLVIGLGLGLILAPATASATTAVTEGDEGAVAALVGTVQQIGGSLGTALLNAVAIGATARALRQGAEPVAATLQGYDTGFWWAAGAFGLGAIVTAALLESGAPSEI